MKRQNFFRAVSSGLLRQEFRSRAQVRRMSIRLVRYDRIPLGYCIHIPEIGQKRYRREIWIPREDVMEDGSQESDNRLLQKSHGPRLFERGALDS